MHVYFIVFVVLVIILFLLQYYRAMVASDQNHRRWWFGRTSIDVCKAQQTFRNEKMVLGLLLYCDLKSANTCVTYDG